MRKNIVYILMALFLASCGSNKTAGLSEDAPKEISASHVIVQPVLAGMDKTSYKEGELLVKFKPGVVTASSLRIHQALGADVLRRFSIVPNLEHVKLPAGLSVRDAAAQYMSDPVVEYAEPNYIRHISASVPNDTYFSQQWALRNTGQYANGTLGADMKAPEAWDISRGSSSIIVAVLDTGIDYNHPDLVGNIWTNSGENPVNGIDDDGNGRIDDWRGWDFVNNDNAPLDDKGHGTHVAGTIGAVGNNGTGVSGVMWNVKLMPLKFMDANGSGTIANEVLAIQYAVAKGARIINASFGSYSFSNTEYNAISAANTSGVLFIASAGNDGYNNDLTPGYPASYALLNIISVAATDQNDTRAWFSNYGPLSVHIAAPGVYILSTYPTSIAPSGYANSSGTSMSAPHVAGLAGLLYSYYTHFTYSQIRSTILRYGDVLPALSGWINTGARINAYKALSSLLVPSNLAASAPSSTQTSLAWTDNATGEDGYKIERKTGTGAYAQIAAAAGNAVAYADSSLVENTTYTYRLRAYNTIPADSAYSSEAAVVTLLNTPTGLTAAALSGSQVSLSWTDNSSAETGYAIERTTTAGGSYAQVAVVGANTTTYTDSGLASSTQYWYRVRAYNAVVNSLYSNEATAITAAVAAVVSGGGGCSIGSRQNTPTAMADAALMLIPLLFMVILRRRR